jgi:four helix bundle protein
MHNFKELKVWQKSRVLVKDIYKLLETFPNKEQFGLISQIQRAAVSIPTNIAEGSGRSGVNDFNRFLEIALTSAIELENLIILSSDLSYITEESYNNFSIQIIEIQKMLYGLKKHIKQ